MPRLPLLPLIVLACLLAFPAASHAAHTMRLEDPITDNYKASYNADPSKPELRTWLAMTRITVAGTTWQPILPNEITIFSGGSVDVQGGDGRRGRLFAQVSSGPFGAPLWRVDPANASSGGRWGLLATLSDRQALVSTPAVLQLTLYVGGDAFGAGQVAYRHDPQFAAVPSNHIEYNGPAGRWFVGGIATRTQEEPAPGAAPSLLASAGAAPVARPRITRVTLPLRTVRRTVAMAVRGRAGSSTARITHVRVRVGAVRGWGRWIRVRSAYSIVLPPGRATHALGVQLRDSRGVSSLAVTRRVSCLCG